MVWKLIIWWGLFVVSRSVTRDSINYNNDEELSSGWMKDDRGIKEGSTFIPEYQDDTSYKLVTDIENSGEYSSGSGFSAADREFSLNITYMNEIATQLIKEKTKSVLEVRKMTDENYFDESGIYILSDISPSKYQAWYDSNQIQFLDFENSTYYAFSSANDNSLTIGKIENEYHWSKIANKTVDSRRFAFLELNNNFLFVLVNKHAESAYFRYDTKSGEIKNYYILNKRYASAVAICKTESDGKYRLAIANYAGDSSYYYKNETTLFTWMERGDNFDEDTYPIISYDVSDLEFFHIHSSLFLAIANYRITKNQYRVDSEIYKFNIHTNEWENRQKIETFAVNDFEFFSFGKGSYQEFFLAVASEFQYINGEKIFNTHSVIYKFAKRKFVPFQCIETVGARYISSYKGPNGEFLLAVANYADGVHLYQYNGWEFVRTKTQSMEEKMGAGVSYISLHTLMYARKMQPALVVVNTHKEGPPLFFLSFQHKNYMKEWYKQSLKWCDEMKTRCSQREIENTLNKFNKLYLVDQEEPIVLNEDITFENNVIARTITTHQVFEETTKITLKDNIITDFEERLSVIAFKLSNIQNILKNALKLNDDQRITANYKFKNLSSECEENCLVDTIETISMNNKDVRKLSSDVILTNEDQKIDNIRIEKIQINSDVTIKSKINDRSTNQFVTKTGAHSITSLKTFSSITTEDLAVNGTINGLTIDKSSALLIEDDQFFTGNVTFKNMRVEELMAEGLVNGINLNKLREELVFTDGNHEIYGAKEIYEVEVDHIHINGLINNNNIDDLWKNILWQHGDQIISAWHTFDNIKVIESVKAESINGISIPGPDVIFIDQDSIIDSQEFFEELCNIKEIRVNYINNIPKKNLVGHQLNSLLKSEEQVVRGEKHFETIRLGNDNIFGTLNGINWIKLNKDLTNLKQKQEEGIIKLDNYILSLKTYTKLERIIAKALKHTDTKISSKFIFERHTYIKDSSCDIINGLKYREDFVLDIGKRVVYGRKTFESLNLVQNVTIRGLLNGVNVSHFHHVLKIDGRQTISADKIVKGDLYVRNNLMIDQLINGISIGEIVFLSENSTIVANKIFHQIEVESLLLNTTTIVHPLKGLNIYNLFNNSLMKSARQRVTGSKTFIGELIVIKEGNLKTNQFNGYDISEIWDDAVLIDVDQTITGRKIFVENVTFENVWLTGSIDGITYANISNWMIQKEKQTVNGSLICSKNLHIIKDTKIDSFINGVDIEIFAKSVIRGDKTTSTLNSLHIHSVKVLNVEVDGDINGIKIQELVQKYQKNSIMDKKTFINGFVVTNLEVYGSINGINVEEFYERTVLVDDIENFYTLEIMGQVFIKSIYINSSINGGDPIIWNLAKDPHGFNQTLYIENLLIQKTLNIAGSFCGINIEELSQTYFSLSKDQTITGSFIFEDDIRIANLVTSSLHVKGLLNEVNMTHIARFALKVSGNQTITTNNLQFENVVIKGNMILYDKFNNRDIENDFATKIKGNHFKSQIIFKDNVKVLNSLVITGTIGNIDLSEWARAIHHNRTINIPKKRIYSELSIDNIRINGLLNNVNLSKVWNNKTILETDFIRNVYMNRLEVDFVNGISIGSLIQMVFNNSRTIIVDNIETFEKEISVTNLEVRHTLNHLDLKIDATIKDLTEYIETTTDVINEICLVVHDPPLLLTYYKKVQDFYHPYTNLLKLFRVEDKSILTISVMSPNSNCSRVFIYEFDYHAQLFRKTDQIISAFGAIDIETISYRGNTLMVIANFNPSFNCNNSYILKTPYTVAQIFIWNKSEEKFELFQELPTYQTSDVEIFQTDGWLCLVFAELSYLDSSLDAKSEIYCLNGISEKFKRLQYLDTRLSHQVTVTSFENSTYLAVANSYNIHHNCYEDSVDVYVWDNKEFVIFQKLPSVYAETVLFISYLVPEEHRLFLFVGENRNPNTNHIRPLTIFRYDHVLRSFVKYQKIALNSSVVAINAATLPSSDLLLFVLTDTKSNNLLVYRYVGASGFLLRDVLDVEGAKSLDVFQKSLTHYLLLARDSSSGKHIFSKRFKTGIVLQSTLKGKLYSFRNIY